MVNVKTSIYFFVFYMVYVFQKNLNIKHEQTKYDRKTIMLKTYYSKKTKKPKTKQSLICWKNIFTAIELIWQGQGSSCGFW